MIKKKVLGILSASILALSLLVGCGNPVTDDLTDYINKGSAPAGASMKEGIAVTVDESIETEANAACDSVAPINEKLNAYNDHVKSMAAENDVSVN